MSNGNSQKQLVTMPFAGGLDQNKAPKRIANGKLVTGTNIRFLKVGQADKRPGNTIKASLIGGSAIDVSRGGKVQAFKNEIICVQSGATQTHIGSYAPSQGGCVDKGPIAEATLTRTGITNAIGSAHQPDVATGNGVTVSIWSGSAVFHVGDIYATVSDATTGAEILSSIKLTTGAQYSTPRVCFVASTNTFILLWIDNGGPQTIIARTLAAPYTTFSAPSNVRTDSNLTARYEVLGLSDRFALVYMSSVDGKVHVYTYGGATPLTQIATAVSAATVGGFAFGLASDGTNLWASYAFPNGVYQYGCEAWDPVTLAQTCTLTILTSFAPADSPMSTAVLPTSTTRASVLCTHTTATGIATIASVVTFNGGGGGTTTVDPTHRKTYYAALASKPFLYGGKTYAFLYYGAMRPTPPVGGTLACWGWTAGFAGGNQVSLVLCDMGCDDLVTANLPARPVHQCAARVSVPESYASLTLTPYASSVISTATGVYSCVSRIIRSLTGRTGLIRSTATFGDKSLWQFAELGDWLHATPGVYYDSSICAEIGFLGYVEQATIVDSATGGSLIAGDVYTYIWVFEWADGSGIHRSIASAPQVHTMGVGQTSVDITAPCLTLTQRQKASTGFSPAVGIVPYRTIQGQGGPFYRVFADASTPLNITTAETITFNDGIADTAITGNAEVYITGNVVSNVSPPSMSSIVTYRGRLFGIGDDGRTIWYSKQFVEGDAVAMADEFTISVDTSTPLTALKVLDGNLIVFSGSRIWVITGEGPNDTDAGYDYNTPTSIASDVGCSNPRSVVGTPEGLMFQNGAGRLSILTRSLEIVNIGISVEDLLAANPIITSAIVHPSQTWVVFTCLTSENASTGIRLVYDYRLQEWVSDVMRAGVGPVSACARGGQFYNWLDSSGNIWEEDSIVNPTSWLDASTWVPMAAQFRVRYGADSTHAAMGVQGYQKVSSLALMSERYSPHDLTFTLQSDYQGSPACVHDWPDSKIRNFSGAQQIEVEAQIQDCEDLLITISDSTPTGGGVVGTGRGGAFVDCTIGVEALPGIYPLPAEQRS